MITSKLLTHFFFYIFCSLCTASLQAKDRVAADRSPKQDKTKVVVGMILLPVLGLASYAIYYMSCSGSSYKGDDDLDEEIEGENTENEEMVTITDDQDRFPPQRINKGYYLPIDGDDDVSGNDDDAGGDISSDDSDDDVSSDDISGGDANDNDGSDNPNSFGENGISAGEIYNTPYYDRISNYYFKINEDPHLSDNEEHDQYKEYFTLIDHYFKNPFSPIYGSGPKDHMSGFELAVWVEALEAAAINDEYHKDSPDWKKVNWKELVTILPQPDRLKAVIKRWAKLKNNQE